MATRRSVMKDSKNSKGTVKKGARKGGYGAKYAYGKPGDEYYYDDKIKPGDPLYDSGEDEDVPVFESRAERESKLAASVGVPMKPKSTIDGSLELDTPGAYASYKKSIQEAILEYFSAEDLNELSRCIEEAGSSHFRFEVIKRGVAMSLDRRDREREMISKMIANLYGKVLKMEAIEKGFERLIELQDDLVVDVPDARKLLAQFLARAVADEVLPPRFLSSPSIVALGGATVEQARVMLSMKHGLGRMEHVWGPGAVVPVEDLKKAIRDLISEFLLSEDLVEAARCVRELDVPHFHHEVVKRAVVISMDKKERDQNLVSTLLTYLVAKDIVSTDQIRRGLNRVFAELDDLSLDNPAAKKIFDDLVAAIVGNGTLPDGYKPAPPTPSGGGDAGFAPGAAEAPPAEPLA